MYCTNCGKEVKEGWKVCPNCGEPIEDTMEKEMNESAGEGGQGIQPKQVSTGQYQYGSGEDTSSSVQKKKKRKWPWILVGIFAVIIVISVITSMSGDDSHAYPEAEEIVKNGVYGEYTAVRLGDVLEYNWTDGQWDSYMSESDSGDETLIVEYASDSSGDTKVRFSVNTEDESFQMVSYIYDGEFVDSYEDACSAMEELYFAYFNAQYPIQDIDLNDYVGNSIEILLEDSDAFYKTDKEYEEYGDVSRQVMITLDEDSKITYIAIQGDGTYSPQFIGTVVGDNSSEINGEIIEECGYSVKLSDADEGLAYGNPSDNSVVTFELDDEGIVKSICWIADILDTMTEMEEDVSSDEVAVNETNEQKSEEQAAIDDAYNFVAGKSFHLQDAQFAITFTTTGEFIYSIDSYTEGITSYSFSASYEFNHDDYQYIIFVTIGEDEYYFRYFTNGMISLEGDGDFSGWYEPI